MAQDELQTEPGHSWSRTVNLLISEGSDTEAAASRQAIRRLFGPWERQLLDAAKTPKSQQRPLATLLCLRELLTRFYRVRYEFDHASPPPEHLPITMPETPDFDSLKDDDGDFCIQFIGRLPQHWLRSAEQKFVVQKQHCHELEPLLGRYFDPDQIREAIATQSRGLRAIAKNLGHDSAIKALKDDRLRKTLAPLASNKTLDATAFRSMLKQHRKNYDHLTIDGAGGHFSVDGCSFRHAHFRHITLEMSGCALHHTEFGEGGLLRLAHNCEFGREMSSLHVESLRGNHANTHFDRATIKIVYPGSQLGHLSNSRVEELGGNVKYLDHCRVGTLRGLCLKIDDSLVKRAIRARFGPKIAGLRLEEMTDCQFGERIVEGIKSIKRLRGNTYSDLTFIDTAFGDIDHETVIFRLRGCLVKDLRGTVATVERCRIANIHPGASVNKVIQSDIDQISGGIVKLCGTHEEEKAKVAPPRDRPGTRPPTERAGTHIGTMTGGTIEHLNGFIENFAGGVIKRMGFDRKLRLAKVKKYLGQWQNGDIDGLNKADFLTREKRRLRQETERVGKAIRDRAAKARQQRRT